MSLKEKSDAAVEAGVLKCIGCGKLGVGICASCSKKRGYKTAIARAMPLEQRDPALYQRLDKLSRLPLKGNRKAWAELCVEINAEEYFEYLSILVEIIHEGKWRTDALEVKKWLRGNLANRVRRIAGVDDYGSPSNAVRRPSYPRFDKRNGALVDFGTNPFAEFSLVSDNGDEIVPEEVIESAIARKTLQTAGGYDENVVPAPADRDSLRLLGKKTFAEWIEAESCAWVYSALQCDRRLFDRLLAKTRSELRGLAVRMELDEDEVEALAAIILLWDVGPRAYLNFLDPSNKRRVRNAFDRLDRRLRGPQWAALFRKTLREEGCRRRGLLPAPPVLQEQVVSSRPQPGVGSRGAFGIPADLALRWHTQMDMAQGLVLPPVKANAADDADDSEGTQPVMLSCDLTKEQQALCRSSARKPKPRRRTKLYSE